MLECHQEVKVHIWGGISWNGATTVCIFSCIMNVAGIHSNPDTVLDTIYSTIILLTSLLHAGQQPETPQKLSKCFSKITRLAG